jgi:hypothetical protein
VGDVTRQDHLKTRFYLTSESHVYTLLNLIRHAPEALGLPSLVDEQGVAVLDQVHFPMYKTRKTAEEVGAREGGCTLISLIRHALAKQRAKARSALALLHPYARPFLTHPNPPTPSSYRRLQVAELSYLTQITFEVYEHCERKPEDPMRLQVRTVPLPAACHNTDHRGRKCRKKLQDQEPDHHQEQNNQFQQPSVFHMRVDPAEPLLPRHLTFPSGWGASIPR